MSWRPPMEHCRTSTGVAGTTIIGTASKIVVAAGIACLAATGTGVAQTPDAPQSQSLPLVLSAPGERATGVPIPLTGRRAPAGAPVELQRLTARGWVTIKAAIADPAGRVSLTYLPLRSSGRYRLRLMSAGIVSAPVTVRARHVTLAAFGDASLGNGVAMAMAQRGVLWPWGDVAPLLRRADIAFGNLECAISFRGAPVPKQYTFRGSPRALRSVVRFAGLDVLNLANNHVGDYGSAALLDTVRSVRRAGAVPVGAGATLAAARRPVVVSRLGLRVAFVGFSDIGPAWFAAGPAGPGTSFASMPAVSAGVRAARRRADVVVATFHWGVERSTTENARQRGFARTALNAGATAVIGAHPHVLQPIRRPAVRRLVAYSLGNFVWAAGSPATSRTGILRLRLSARGVEGARLLPAQISATRPRLRHRTR